MSEIVGNKDVQERLWYTVEGNRLAHAYLFSGPEEIGKKTIAHAFAQRILCETSNACGLCSSCVQWRGVHPDFLFIVPEGEGLRRNIGVEQVRAARHFLQLSPQAGERKVLVIDEADRLTGEATNAFLKTLEEPSPRMVIVLVTAMPWMLLATVRSRCLTVRFSLVPETDMVKWLASLKISSGEAQALSKLSGGRPGRAKRLLKDPVARKDVIAILRLFTEVIGESSFEKLKAFSVFTKNRTLLAQSRILWLEEAHRDITELPPHTFGLISRLLAVDPYAPFDPILSLVS